MVQTKPDRSARSKEVRHYPPSEPVKKFLDLPNTALRNILTHFDTNDLSSHLSLVSKEFYSNCRSILRDKLQLLNYAKAADNLKRLSKVKEVVDTITYLILQNLAGEGWLFEDGEALGIIKEYEKPKENGIVCNFKSNLNIAAAAKFISRCVNLKQLILFGFDNEEEARFISFLENPPQITQLWFSSITDTDESQILKLSSKLYHLDDLLANLEVLQIPSTKTKDEFIAKLVRIALKLRALNIDSCEELSNASLFTIGANCKQLKHLELGGNSNFSDNAIQTMLDSLSLITLNIRDNENLTDCTIEKIAKTQPNIKTLDVRGCYNLGGPAVASALQRLNNMEHLFLGSIPFDVGNALSFVHKLKHIKSLDLSKNENINNVVLESISNTCSQLNLLVVNECDNITNDGVIKIVRKCRRLKSLGISNCIGITNHVLNTISNFGKKIETLDISGLENMTKRWIQVLERKNKQLKILNLTDCSQLDDNLLENLMKHSFALKVIVCPDGSMIRKHDVTH